MPKQESLIKINGKMDGISFYKKDGFYFMRKAGGPSREKILKHPSFERTRENMSEFAGLAQASASFSLTFAPVKNFRDTRLRGRASKVFRTIMVADENSAPGQRQVLLSKHRFELQDLELNVHTSLKSLMMATVETSHSADRKTAIAVLPDLQNHMVHPPTQTTHFQVVHHVGVLADVIYNFEAKRYGVTDEALNTLNKTTFSEYIPLNDVPPSLTLETTLSTDELPDNVSVLQSLGILFFMKQGTVYYPSKEAKGMRILDVF